MEVLLRVTLWIYVLYYIYNVHVLDMCGTGHLETVLSLSSHPGAPTCSLGENFQGFLGPLVLCLELAIFFLQPLTGWVEGHPLVHVMIAHVTLANCLSIVKVSI